MSYFPYILYLILAVGFITFKVSKGLQLTIKLENSPNYRRQMSSENDPLNPIKKYKHVNNESDPYNTNTHRSKRYDSKKRNSMNIDDSIAVVFRTNDRSSSLEKEDASERDFDAFKKSIKTTARTTQRKHKKRATTTELFTTRNTKYVIPTTINKKTRARNGGRDDNSQKSGGRHLKHHDNKLNSMAQAIHKTKTHSNVSPNENKHKNDSQSYATFRDIILHVLKTIETDGHHVKNNHIIEDINHSFDQKFRQRHSDKPQKELEKEIDVAINDLANKTSQIWQSWIHTVTENDEINTIKNISKHYFQNFKQRRSSTGNELKQLIRNLSTIYERQFSDVIDNTNFNRYKNITGLQRTILNTIYTSDRFLTRLFNYIIDGENKDEHNNNRSKKFETELSDETNMDYTRACMKLNICRTRTSFTAFVMDFLTIFLSLDNSKFEETFDSLSNIIRNDDFSSGFGQDIDEGLKENIAKHDERNLVHKRSIIAMINSIYSNRHSPLIVFSDDKITEVNKTVAFIQVINILDEKVPESADNIQTWNSITRSFLNYEEDKDKNIRRTASDFVGNIKNVIGKLNNKSKNQVSNAFRVLFT